MGLNTSSGNLLGCLCVTNYYEDDKFLKYIVDSLNFFR